MHERLMPYLICPDCKRELKLVVEKKEAAEIKEGQILCPTCNKHYQIKNSIPRFVNNDTYVDTFSFEWNKFYDVQMDILNNTNESEKTFSDKTGWIPQDLKGKIVLDVGIGTGRFSDIASRWGAEVIGIDLSYAVDAAYKNIGTRPNVHIIQADIFHLPFKNEIFDHIYSIGVLHHTPDTKKAFQSIIPFLKQGGGLAVYIYEKNRFARFSDIWRRVTSKMPIKLLYYLSALSIPAYYLYKIPLIGSVLQLLLPISMHKSYRYRWLDTYDWYSPKYQWKHTVNEVSKWYEEFGFEKISVFSLPVCIRGHKK